MAKPILYVSELTEKETLEFIKAQKREPSEATKNLLKAAGRIPLNIKELLKG
ncbi:MAG: hypothetical protein AABY04_02210 [Candidatus Micrarchaeota archaeon]